MPIPSTLYFGCIDQPGHYLWEPGPIPIGRHRILELIWVPKLDGLLPPHGHPGLQGVCRMHVIHGWTIAACWDFSVDNRPSSNSMFLVAGVSRSFRYVLAAVEQNFPSVFKRLGKDLMHESDYFEAVRRGLIGVDLAADGEESKTVRVEVEVTTAFTVPARIDEETGRRIPESTLPVGCIGTFIKKGAASRLFGVEDGEEIYVMSHEVPGCGWGSGVNISYVPKTHARLKEAEVGSAE